MKIEISRLFGSSSKCDTKVCRRDRRGAEWELCCISQSVYDGRVCQKYIHAYIDSTTIDIHKFISIFWQCMGLYTIFKFLICKLITVIL